MVKHLIVCILALGFTSQLACAQQNSSQVSEPNIMAFDIYLVRTTTAALAKTDTLMAGRVSVPFIVSLLQDPNKAQLAQHFRMQVLQGRRGDAKLNETIYWSQNTDSIAGNKPLRSRSFIPYDCKSVLMIEAWKRGTDLIGARIDMNYEGTMPLDPNAPLSKTSFSFTNDVLLKPDVPSVVHSIYGSSYVYVLVVRPEFINK